MTILAGKIDESVVEILTSESGVLRYEEVSGETVNPFTVDADTLGGSTKEEIIASVPTYTHPSTIQCSAATEISSLKSSVSSGKTQVANAITGKGVATSSSDTFATMAANINSINIGLNFTASKWKVQQWSLSYGSNLTISNIKYLATLYNGGNRYFFYLYDIANNRSYDWHLKLTVGNYAGSLSITNDITRINGSSQFDVVSRTSTSITITPSYSNFGGYAIFAIETT